MSMLDSGNAALFRARPLVREHDAFVGVHAILSSALHGDATTHLNVTLVSSTEEQARHLASTMQQEEHYSPASLWASSVHHPRRALLWSSGRSGTLATSSMDSIIIASVRAVDEMERALLTYWPAVRPGGHLCIEDVPTFKNHSTTSERSASGWSPLVHSPSSLRPEVVQLLQDHDSFLADALKHLRGSSAAASTRNTHMLVVRKRSEARQAKITRHSGVRAMRDGRVVPPLDAAVARSMGLEGLAFHYGTDKSHDDHKYTDLYALLLDSWRLSLKNVTEIGIAAGQSMQLWHDYLPSAHVWGVDNWIRSAVREGLRPLSPRVRLLDVDSQSASRVGKLGLRPLTMDIIIDDGAHKPATNEKSLLAFWQYLRVGGLFIVEDIVTGGDANGQFLGNPANWSASGSSRFTHEPWCLRPETLSILQRSDLFLADTTVGHRDLKALGRSVPAKWWRDSVDHNTHVLVIRKRA